MAFRKSVVSSYRPPLFASGFGEIKFSPSSAGDSSRYVTRQFEDCEQLSDSTLPLVSLESVVQSGQPINGRVSFASSDPALSEARVHAALSDYVSDPSHQPNPETPPTE